MCSSNAALFRGRTSPALGFVQTLLILSAQPDSGSLSSGPEGTTGEVKALVSTCIVSDKPLSTLKSFWKTTFWQFKKQWTRNIWIKFLLKHSGVEKLRRKCLAKQNLLNNTTTKNGKAVQNSLPKPKYAWMPFLCINQYYCVLKFSLDKYGVLNTSGKGSENSSSHQSGCEILKTNHKSQPNNTVNLSTWFREPGEFGVASHTCPPGRDAQCLLSRSCLEG